MKAQERLAFITEIARRNSGIGKTGMMKFLYILQAVYKVPLEYDFEIYTYGPYCQTVMSDIEYAEFTDYIKVSPKSYPNGMNKYQINPGDQSDQILEKDAEILFKYKEEIDKIVNFFGSKKFETEEDACSGLVSICSHPGWRLPMCRRTVLK